ncbi:MAG: radical SAM protein [bacterium LCO1.1]|uniref:Radical SAM protein n=1 Tax=Candidatus Weimeria bifida TaxID=2599074 RepID=A0A6N7IY45_9FIRM|nr:radical SAM protein [Candidatus Weimeria bifida]
MEICTLCPRNCGMGRFCGRGENLKVARAALHFWEEPCISGTTGSGAVFFSGCNLKCIFCQNEKIRDGLVGREISVERLSDIFLELQEKGANNINLVTAGHFLPQVVPALEDAKNRGLVVPIVYNTSSYEKVAQIRELDGLVDIYLPDFKYVSSRLSGDFSKAPDYFEVAENAVDEMVRQTGAPAFFVKKKARLDQQLGLWESEDTMDAATYNECAEEIMDEGREVLMKKGTIVRHLLLPGCADDSKNVIKYLYQTYGDSIFLSIMNQYTPMPQVSGHPTLSRKVTENEYNEVLDYALDLGIENAFMQEGDVAKESFIPDFDCEGV